ncbi:MAG: SixA phosphatase family protein [Bacteroidota bacterium]
MKTLYLVRHAKSDHDGHLIDIDRPLNMRGYRDAYNMSFLMKEKQLLPNLIISSPAIRALTTALIFCRTFKSEPNDILLYSSLYETRVQDYIDVITQSDDQYKSIMLFAHNPTITDLANTLTSYFTQNIPTCGIVGITNNCLQWKNFTKTPGELTFHDFPKNHIPSVK